MTKKDKLQKLAMLKSDMKVLEMGISELQKELLSDRDGDYDLDGIRCFSKTNVRYDFVKSLGSEFEEEYPDLVAKKYLTTGLGDNEKIKYFKKSISKPFIMFE